MELYRTYLLKGDDVNEYQKLKPVSKSNRTECLEIYLKERIRCMREKNSDKDNTRPYPLTDMECMQQIYKEDNVLFKGLSYIRNNKELNDMLMEYSFHSDSLKEVSSDIL